MEAALSQIISALSSDGVPAALQARSQSLLRLARLLSQRVGHAQPYLIVGLIGPNNAGKSTFFTRFTDCDISPPAPDGGFTRNLWGAAHPTTYVRLLAENHFAGFDVVEAAPDVGHEGRAVEVNTLSIVQSPATPQHLVVIDSPDFDSIDARNHEVSKRLSTVADLVVCMVTKHTYANQKVHQAFSAAVEGKRPFILVYNEAVSADIARRHLRELAHRLKGEPFGMFYAPLDLGVARDPRTLRVLDVDAEHPFDFDAWTPAQVQRLLIQAQAAKFRAVAHEAQSIAKEWGDLGSRKGTVLAGIEDAANHLGDQVSKDIYPLDPLVDAFVNVMDQRDDFHRMVRRPMVITAEGIVKAGKWIRRQIKEHVRGEPRTPLPEQDRPDIPLVKAEQAELEEHWASFIDSVRRQILDGGLSGPEQGVLGARFLDKGHDAVKQATLRTMARDAVPESYRRFCERQVSEALAEVDDEARLQLLTTLVASAPAIAGASAIMITGGMGGEDWVIAGVAVLLTPLYKRLLKFLGREREQRLREEWKRSAKHRVATAALNAFWGDEKAQWINAAEEARVQSRRLGKAALALRVAVGEEQR